MTCILDLHCGHINCDVCGNGSNSITVYSREGNTYDFYRSSQCYGPLELTGLDRAGVLEVLDENAFLLSTRSAKHHFNSFRAAVSRGKYETAPVKIKAPTSQRDAWSPAPVARPGVSVHGGPGGVLDRELDALIRANTDAQPAIWRNLTGVSRASFSPNYTWSA